ncbi:ABC transporter ATP-binding protein [Algivirga pacifica]|uniref:ABC transporter ATP-binding protein n=1 Tax=Algivirga pacifica TaxID=1162670 RepID=UPI0031EDE22B
MSFSLEEGEHICFSGASGRGKSTLLKVLMGQVSPDKGQIKFFGETLSQKSLPNIRKQLVWIPQNIHLPVENGHALLSLLEAKDKVKATQYYMEKLGLDSSLIDKDFSKISGGQKQRIIIAACLSLDPAVILMDEPTAALDEGAIQLLINTLQSLENKTIVSASHNATWLECAHRVITL